MEISKEQCKFIIDRIDSVDAPTTEDCNALNEITDLIHTIMKGN